MAKRNRRERAAIGKIICIRLVEMGWSNSDLAKAIGANYNYVTAILYGDRTGTKYLDKIAKVLQLDKEQLQNCA
jgi:cyanate lyase